MAASGDRDTSGSSAPAPTTASTMAGPRRPRSLTIGRAQAKAPVIEAAASTTQKAVIPPGPVPWPFKKATMKAMQAM